MDRVNIELFGTTNYDLFKSQDGNRLVNVSDVKKVEKKILENNLLKYHPIIVDQNFMVIDGQHRLQVAKDNNLTIYFFILNTNDSLSITQSINTTGKPWTVRDFLRSYCALGKEEYLKFNTIFKKYSFLTTSQLIELSSKRKANKSPVDMFRSGDFYFHEYNKVIEAVEQISKYTACGVGIESRTHFQRFILICIKRQIKFDHIRMIDKIKINPDIAKRMPNDLYLISDLLGEMYNFKLRTKINFNLRQIR
jgi:hypothetical protein